MFYCQNCGLQSNILFVITKIDKKGNIISDGEKTGITLCKSCLKKIIKKI